ncbi:MAG: hypothetical protein COU90_00695 [Candidatus Ryanbacteria bacterium CG10_big_fil_rev_8_21_14_0_10_43_42]|uniref:Thymidylate kinase-like domain-containing protein n=1 Tax=Candidatus Ryanbacteria bacterium CG10_big_fil_rev_8_21_14_0_10_43_42 TaxID=1974864 RepID=A0A2M8KY12_9BACT|nr:MAG: hypothetical protein COU90_00695 [Candidatus Ryanbacteria bacterium CG10_big_fil_rev_8_21_14_0_10_43_42]
MHQEIFTIEGIVHAGKTTVLDNVRRAGLAIICIDEYTRYRGTEPFPEHPTTLEEALHANQFFVDLDTRRFTDIHDMAKAVLLDRSCLSVLAYHYATEGITHGEIACFEPSVRLYREHFPQYIPHAMLYLEITLSELTRRHEGDTTVYKSVLLEEEFNRHLTYFYENAQLFFPELEVHRIDGTLPAGEILQAVIRILGFA